MLFVLCRIFLTEFFAFFCRIVPETSQATHALCNWDRRRTGRTANQCKCNQRCDWETKAALFIIVYFLFNREYRTQQKLVSECYRVSYTFRYWVINAKNSNSRFIASLPGQTERLSISRAYILPIQRFTEHTYEAQSTYRCFFWVGFLTILACTVH